MRNNNFEKDVNEGVREIKKCVNNFINGEEVVRPIIRKFEREFAPQPRLTDFERELIKIKGEIEEAWEKFKKYIEARLSCLSNQQASELRRVNLRSGSHSTRR